MNLKCLKNILSKEMQNKTTKEAHTMTSWSKSFNLINGGKKE